MKKRLLRGGFNPPFFILLINVTISIYGHSKEYGTFLLL